MLTLYRMNTLLSVNKSFVNGSHSSQSSNIAAFVQGVHVGLSAGSNTFSEHVATW